MSKTPPELLDSESSPAQRTVYLKIPLGSWAPVTGVFFPEDFHYNLEYLNLLIYFHGDRFEGSACEGVNDIQKYWAGKLFPLRELTNGSKGKKAIVVAPTLGPRPGALEGDLVSKIDWFLDQVALGIAAYGPQTQQGKPTKEGVPKDLPTAWIRKIVLAGHSGGGAPMLAVGNQLMSGKTFDANALKQCWGFDSLYQSAESWLKFAKTYNVEVFMCAGDSTKDRCAELERLAMTDPRRGPVTVYPSFYTLPLGDWAPRQPSTPPVPVLRQAPTFPVFHHCDVPRQWWGECLKQLPF